MQKHDLSSGRKLLLWVLPLFFFLSLENNLYGAPPSVSLFFSDNVQGETEPCG